MKRNGILVQLIIVMHIVQVLRAVKEAHQGCEPDIYAFCEGARPGKGLIIKCLKAHRHELTPECKAGIMELMRADKVSNPSEICPPSSDLR